VADEIKRRRKAVKRRNTLTSDVPRIRSAMAKAVTARTAVNTGASESPATRDRGERDRAQTRAWDANVIMAVL
jgi:hypothetical protein